MPPSPLVPSYLGLIRTIEGEHAGYLTQTLFCAKLLLLGELTPDLPVCCVRGDLRCIYMSTAGWERESGGVPEANLGGWEMGRGQGSGWNQLIELPANKPPSPGFKSDVATSSSLPAPCSLFSLCIISHTPSRFCATFSTFSPFRRQREQLRVGLSLFLPHLGRLPQGRWGCLHVCRPVSCLSWLSAGWMSRFVFPLLRVLFLFFFSTIHAWFVCKCNQKKKRTTCSGEEITSKFSSPF